MLVLDLANNHDGSLMHGKRIVDLAHQALSESKFDIAIKFQYRNLPDFIHPDFRKRTDIKYVNRFLSTHLNWDSFIELKEYIKSAGFLTACTPFDNFSVQKIIEHQFDILKIASVSFTDWPLLEELQEWNGPIIMSTAGVDYFDMDRVVTFMQNRKKQIALMHCVAAYPSADSDLQLNRLSSIKERYKTIPIGYSTHENPKNMIAASIAIAKGAVILERHIGSEEDGHSLNSYSSSAMDLRNWHNTIKNAIEMCGSNQANLVVNNEEQKALHGLRRYIFAQNRIRKGNQISPSDVFFAVPGGQSGLPANYFGRYQIFVASEDISIGEPLTTENVKTSNLEDEIVQIRLEISNLIKNSGAIHPHETTLEISQHYGFDRFRDYGVCMLTIVNREYCKKLLISLPGQTHPDMYHAIKDETFLMLYGTARVKLGSEVFDMKAGDLVSIPPNTLHGFSTSTGCVIEEVSSSHSTSDSFYLDDEITRNKNRKTFVKHWF